VRENAGERGRDSYAAAVQKAGKCLRRVLAPRERPPAAPCRRPWAADEALVQSLIPTMH
jgi:hypothetical protein